MHVCSSEELSQLTTNLVFTLEMKVSEAELDQTLRKEKLTDENSMDLEQYASWFKDNVMTKFERVAI